MKIAPNLIKKLLYLLLLLSLFNGCALLGLNPKHKARKAGKYPKFTGKDSLLGYLNPQRSNFDVHYYELDIAFDIEKKRISGFVDITLQMLRSSDTIQLDLDPVMRINAVKHLNKGSEPVILPFTRKFNAVMVAFNKTIRVGSTLTLRVEYEGKPHIAKRPPWDGGLVWKTDKNKRPWDGVACELIGAHTWWPLKDHNTDEPDSAHLKFTVPAGLTCVGNGRLANHYLNTGEHTETFEWHISNPVNTYNITFYIGNFTHFTLPYDSIALHDLNFYVLNYNADIARQHFKQAIPILKFYEKTFGPYAFWKDGYKLVESPYEGMEHQSAIAYGNGYKNKVYGYDYIILHETAHEWWGNAVSVSDYADIWIHEGLATYSEALFIESLKGYDAYLNYLHFYGMLVVNKRPMVGPRDVNYWDYKDSDPYMKGAMMLHSLRGTLGNDSLFYRILRRFYQQNIFRQVRSQDFIDVVSEVTHKDYSWFFRQFLYHRKPARLTYRLVEDKTDHSYRFLYKWTDTDPDFKMMFDVVDGEGRIVRLTGTTTEQAYEVHNMAHFAIDMLAFYFTTEKIK